MLRSKKFRPIEKLILFAIGLVLLGASIAAAFIAFWQAQWQLGLVSAGGLVIATVYLCAGKRVKPL
jgi:4-hydroxybenzoate polyprenyltransferase